MKFIVKLTENDTTQGLSKMSIDITKTLLKSGASIQEINTVRKHLGRAFGGKLAKAAYPAKLITLSISDVTGNDPSVIASGPTVADPTTLEDTKHILNTYNIPLSPELESFLNNSENETLKLEIDPKSHSAWTGGKQKILDKGRISKFNKKFQNFRSEKKK